MLTDSLLKMLAALVSEFAQKDGEPLILDNDLIAFRRTLTTELIPCIYEPSIALILQGKKKILHGGKVYEYGPGSLLLTTLDVPVMSCVTEATPASPYIGLLFKLDIGLLAENIDLISSPAGTGSVNYQPLSICSPDPGLLSAFTRMVEVSQSPVLNPLLAPLLRKEIVIRLLHGEGSAHIRHAAQRNESVSKISRAISWLKENYTQPFSLEDLAGKVFMSPSTFRQYFKRVTGVSPLQYQKSLRLHQARKLMVNLDMDAGRASLEVGYESVSQFSREYSRLFGLPPLRDSKILKASFISPDNVH